LFARGINNPAVNVVVNFDMPFKSETYLNRIGRSGRYGRFGIAISLITPKDQEIIVRIERELRTELSPLPSKVDKSLY
jgi:ATP-dependent RNA helicase DDX6/DHH1